MALRQAPPLVGIEYYYAITPYVYWFTLEIDGQLASLLVLYRRHNAHWSPRLFGHAAIYVDITLACRHWLYYAAIAGIAGYVTLATLRWPVVYCHWLPLASCYGLLRH